MKDNIFSNFGRYVLLKSIARGGMGQVWLSILGDSGWEKFCAIKKILPQNSNPDALLRFQSEAEISVKLNHSNLVSVFDVGVMGQEAYMAMELVEGENLRSIWNRCAEKRIPFPLEIVVYLMKEASKGLSHAHSFQELNLVHRDISPPNIMVSFTGEVKVLDFGLARQSEGRRFTKPGIIYGKLPYLSPEQALGKELTSKSDIFSLGIIFWEMITRKRLFENDKDTNLAAQLKKRGINKELVPPSKVAGRGNGELDKIVLSMLEYDPEKRPDAPSLTTAMGTWLSVNYPGTESRNMSAFMEYLFQDEISTFKNERSYLLDEYRRWKKNTEKEVKPGDLVADKYLIQRLLGEGGMGRVFEAVHQTLGRKVALKILEPKTTMNASEAEIRFKREARAASRIEHPSVVDVLDYGFISGSKPFLVMELLDGQNLGTILESGALDLRRGCNLGAQLALGIQAAHEEGLVHRDIKPENIHIVKDHLGREQLKIIDFGISKSVIGDDENLTRPGITLGTPEYIAPELLLGEKPSPKADIYSFGAVLFEIFTGKPPYQSMRTETIIQDKIHGRRPSIEQKRPDLPLRLKALIEGCLAQDPLKRPSSLSSVGAVLRELSFDGNAPSLKNESPEPMLATAQLKINPSEKSSHRASDTGSWMPLGLALFGALIFTFGMIQAGKGSSSEMAEFEGFTPQRLLLVEGPSENDMHVVEGKSEHLNKVVQPNNIPEVKEKKKVIRRKSSWKKRSPATGLLRRAQRAMKKGEYTLAHELARKSAKNGGGKRARDIQNRAARYLGLPY
ncbi:MAG: serine/threonine protein kinase [Deltaproteobacteria bacterium]|nr:serine/threonine protein kinase [Deltaproteobacteria bacterium]